MSSSIQWSFATASGDAGDQLPVVGSDVCSFTNDDNSPLVISAEGGVGRKRPVVFGNVECSSWSGNVRMNNVGHVRRATIWYGFWIGVIFPIRRKVRVSDPDGVSMTEMSEDVK